MARFRLVVDVTCPDADDLPFEQVQATLRAKFEDVAIREAESLGSEDNYEVWRAGGKRDIAISLSAGTLRDVNVAIAIGRVLGAESDARANILRALQARKRLPAELSLEIFERAASAPIEDESGFEALE